MPLETKQKVQVQHAQGGENFEKAMPSEKNKK